MSRNLTKQLNEGGIDLVQDHYKIIDSNLFGDEQVQIPYFCKKNTCTVQYT